LVGNGAKIRVKVTVCNFCNIAKRIKKTVVVLPEYGTKYWGCLFFVFKTFVKSPQKAHFKLFDF
jgi:hypothetical protein